MKITLAFVVAFLACQLERAAPHAPEKQTSRELPHVESSPCRLIDPEHRHSSPCRSSRGMLSHGVAFEKDDDVTDPEFRLVCVSDRAGVDRLAWSPSRGRRESAPLYPRMLVSASLRC